MRVRKSAETVRRFSSRWRSHHWGRRLPAWLVLVPIWVGIGLLVPAVVALINGAMAAAVTSGWAVSLAGGLVDAWTYVLVGRDGPTQSRPSARVDPGADPGRVPDCARARGTGGAASALAPQRPASAAAS